jgi:hypothetical protein
MKYFVTTIPTTNIPVSVPGLGAFIIWVLDSTPSNSLPNHLNGVSPNDLAEMIVRRRAPQKNPAISAVFGEPDFLPFPFLQIGLTRGAAVCRLVREFSEQGGADFLTLLNKAEKNFNNNFKFTASQLSEILCIDDEDNKKDNFIQKHQDGTASLTAQDLVDLKRVPVATGFLVGRNYLLTNYHLFPEEVSIDSTGTSTFSLKDKFVREYIAQFGYEQDVLGRKIAPVEYRFDKILCYDKELDYALVRIEKQPLDTQARHLGQAGDIFSWIKMVENPILIAPPLGQIPEDVLQSQLDSLRQELKTSNNKVDLVDLQTLKKRSEFGEPVNIIQHPKGRRKEVILSNNRIKEIYRDFILYEADADFSSSGSPVFNQQWQLVGLHHAAVAKESEEEESKKFTIEGHEGVRTCRIIKNIRKQANQLNERTREEAISSGQFNPVVQKQPPTNPEAEEILRFLKDFVDELNDPAEQSPPYAQSSI